MAYEAKNFDTLLGTQGFSDTLLKNHFTLYQGYVKNTNALIETLSAMAKDGKTATPEFAELKRRLGWEFNGMRMHELYFGNMKNGSSGELPKGVDEIVAEFKAMGAMRGIGWVVRYFDPVSNESFNVWVNEHDVGHFAGCVPMIVMDVFEHAYMVDYGLKKADYIDAFVNAIDWDVVSARWAAVKK
jgi:Fe-Mn family superoxide dismutase